MNREDLELYVMGMYDGDVAALERELAGDEAARAIVADEARLDLLLRDAAAAATFCPACDDLVAGERCDACGAALRPGGYVVERVLVSNAHGRMYAARDADGKQVALKELAFVQSPSLEAIAAFEREAKFLRALDHPAIPRFCASFQEGAGVHVRYYLAQALVEGEALDDRLEAHWFSEPEIIGIARQVLDVLVYLQHLSPRVIHRDIKPANLIVRPDGSIAVVDFGAAYVQGTTAGSTTIGTFGYMPIEQLAGEVDATTDPYALGASLLHLLTRREPWRILQGGNLDGLNVGRPMRAFLAKLTASEPRDRFESAAAARAALDRLGTGAAVAAAPAGALLRAPRADDAAPPARRRPRRWSPVMALVAALAVFFTVGTGGFTWSRLHARHRADRHRAEIMLDEANAARERALAAMGRASRAAMEVQLAQLASEACACADKPCSDAVVDRLTHWSREMTHVAWTPFDHEAREPFAKRIGDLSSRLTVCITRIANDGIMKLHDAPALPPPTREAPDKSRLTRE
jgi:Protein kinase domain